MSDALQMAAEVLGVDRVEQVAELGGSRRSVVRRARAHPLRLAPAFR